MFSWKVGLENYVINGQLIRARHIMAALEIFVAVNYGQVSYIHSYDDMEQAGKNPMWGETYHDYFTVEMDGATYFLERDKVKLD